MEEQSLFLYGLAAPLGDGSQEPGDGEDDPPDAARHGEEVQHHEEEGAGLRKKRFSLDFQISGGEKNRNYSRANLVVGALGHCGGSELPGTRRVAGNFVLQQETQKEDQGDHHVAHGVEDDGSLRVTEARHVDQEGQEREEGGRQADDGHHADEVTGERQLLPGEVHVGTRGGAVSHPHEGVAELWGDF